MKLYLSLQSIEGPQVQVTSLSRFITTNNSFIYHLSLTDVNAWNRWQNQYQGVINQILIHWYTHIFAIIPKCVFINPCDKDMYQRKGIFQFNIEFCSEHWNSTPLMQLIIIIYPKNIFLCYKRKKKHISAHIEQLMIYLWNATTDVPIKWRATGWHLHLSPVAGGRTSLDTASFTLF